MHKEIDVAIMSACLQYDSKPDCPEGQLCLGENNLVFDLPDKRKFLKVGRAIEFW